MKRALSLLLATIFIFALSSCKKDDFKVGEKVNCPKGNSFEMLVDSKSPTEDEIKITVDKFAVTTIKNFDITKTDDANNTYTYDMYMYYVELSGKIDKKYVGREITFYYSHDGENDDSENNLKFKIKEDGSFSPTKALYTSNKITEVLPISFTFSD